MKKEMLANIQRYMNRLLDLEKERTDLAAKVHTKDLELLKDKLGQRCVLMAVSEVRKSIDQDIKAIEQKLGEYVGGYRYEVESIVRKHMNLLLREVLDRRLGLWENLPSELRVIINDKSEEMVQEILKQLK